MAKKIMKAREDYVLVQLTAAGVAAVGERGAITIQNRHVHYVFTPGTPVEVVKRYEWTQVLSSQQVNGEPLFELVEETGASDQAAEEKGE